MAQEHRVFISHKSDDSQLAEQVAYRVRSNGLAVYLDLIDPALKEDGPELTEHLLSCMDKCSQLIAVVSDRTKGSWWVPWEIGVGSEKNFHMASFSVRSVKLPEYLEKWPALHSNTDIDLYCDFSKKYARRTARRSTNVFRESVGRIQKEDAADFHSELKRQLRAHRF